MAGWVGSRRRSLLCLAPAKDAVSISTGASLGLSRRSGRVVRVGRRRRPGQGQGIDPWIAPSCRSLGSRRRQCQRCARPDPPASRQGAPSGAARRVDRGALPQPDAPPNGVFQPQTLDEVDSHRVLAGAARPPGRTHRPPGHLDHRDVGRSDRLTAINFNLLSVSPGQESH